MSVASQDTYLNLTTPLSVVGSGGGGGGVDAVVAGANISTIGSSVGDVTVALQPNLTNISSVAFVTGGAVTGLSTINGVAVGATVSVPPDINVSSINYRNFGSSIPSSYTYEVDGTTALDVIVQTSTTQAYLTLEGAGVTDGFPQVFVGTTQNDGAGVNERYAYLDMRPSTLRVVSSSEIDLVAPKSIVTGTLSAPNAIITAASISAASVSTLALSTIGAISAAAAGKVQTFNTVIGNMRLQGGTVSVTNAGTAVTWGTAFTTIPIILTGCTGVTGSGTAVTQIGGSETGATFSVNTGATTEIYWLAIGAA